MKKTLFLFMLSLLMVSAQQVMAQYSELKKFIRQDGTEEVINGSPFLVDSWSSGSAVDQSGKLYKNLRLKYDVYEDKVVFAGAGGSPMEFSSRINTFTIGDKTFVSGVPHIGRLTDTSYYQLLEDGKTKLLKHYVRMQGNGKQYKTARESTPYNPDAAGNPFVNEVRYYILKGGKIKEVKLSKGSILGAMKDQTAKMDAYIQQSHPDFKNEADVAKLCQYYDSL